MEAGEDDLSGSPERPVALHEFGESGGVGLVGSQAGDGVHGLRMDLAGLAVGAAALDLHGLDGMGEQQAGLDGADLQAADLAAAVAGGCGSVLERDLLPGQLLELLVPAQLQGLLRRSSFRGRWVAALRKSGVPAVHFHDLWHTGDTSLRSTRELMHRMGHSTMDAALRYQHMRGERDRLIVDRIDKAVKKAMGEKQKRKPRRKKPPDPSGTDGAQD